MADDIIKSADLSDYKAFFGIDTDGQDDAIKLALRASVLEAETRTGKTLNRVLGGETGTLVHLIGEGGRSWAPSLQPIVSVVSLVIAGETIPSSASIYTPGYYLDGYYLRLRDYEFTSGAEIDLRVTYGLATPPDDLRLAIIKLAGFQMTTPSRIGKKSTSGVSKETASFFEEIPTDILAVFDRHAVRIL